MGDGHAGPITPEACVVLLAPFGGGHLPTLPRGVLAGRILLQLGLSL